MSFSLQSWKETFKTQLQGWRERMQTSGVKSIYSFISASAIWPVLQATIGGQWTALAELGKVLAEAGSNILVDRLQKWKEKKDEADVAGQIEKDMLTDKDLRAELDKLLEKLDALPLAREALNDADRTWFEETLEKELSQMGNIQKFKAVLKGSGAIAQGAGAKAVGEGGVLIEGGVQGGVHVKNIKKK
jgi:hypothetical protein